MSTKRSIAILDDNYADLCLRTPVPPIDDRTLGLVIDRQLRRFFWLLKASMLPLTLTEARCVVACLWGVEFTSFGLEEDFDQSIRDGVEEGVFGGHETAAEFVAWLLDLHPCSKAAMIDAVERMRGYHQDRTDYTGAGFVIVD